MKRSTLHEAAVRTAREQSTALKSQCGDFIAAKVVQGGRNTKANGKKMKETSPRLRRAEAFLPGGMRGPSQRHAWAIAAACMSHRGGMHGPSRRHASPPPPATRRRKWVPTIARPHKKPYLCHASAWPPARAAQKTRPGLAAGENTEKQERTARTGRRQKREKTKKR